MGTSTLSLDQTLIRIPITGKTIILGSLNRVIPCQPFVLHFGAQVKCLLAAAGKGLILSVATPGQGGPQQRALLHLCHIFSGIPTGLGHVNEQPHEYVIKPLEDNCLVMPRHVSHVGIYVHVHKGHSRNVMKRHTPT